MEYLESVAHHFHLYPYIKFGVRVKNARWDENNLKWIVTTMEGKTYEANFLFSGVGALHIPKEIKFTGEYLHVKIISYISGVTFLNCIM